MGIFVAKHRQKILKLAKRDQKKSTTSSRNHMLWLIVAIKQANKLVAKSLKMWTCRPDSISCNFAVAPLRNYSTRWKAAMLKRNTKLSTAN
uniref:Putative ovule protein n=1 Tax=Solanum chacoense TaxID=4108 RepID=A0A0V0GQ38_SOLCH